MELLNIFLRKDLFAVDEKVEQMERGHTTYLKGVLILEQTVRVRACAK